MQISNASVLMDELYQRESHLFTSLLVRVISTKRYLKICVRCRHANYSYFHRIVSNLTIKIRVFLLLLKLCFLSLLDKPLIEI